jgi:hypothetical protein
MVKGQWQTRLADDPPAPDGLGFGAAINTVCPECGGVLVEREEAGVTSWECRVGHRYALESLVDAQAESVESALWAASSEELETTNEDQ